MTNQQTQFLAERLFPEKTFRETADHLLMFDEVTHIMDVFDPAHNPAHSRMVLDAMVERGFDYLFRNSNNFHVVVFRKPNVLDVNGVSKNMKLDQAICDAAEAALKGEEG